MQSFGPDSDTWARNWEVSGLELNHAASCAPLGKKRKLVATAADEEVEPRSTHQTEILVDAADLANWTSGPDCWTGLSDGQRLPAAKLLAPQLQAECARSHMKVR
jgi:hypothetical protein